MNARGGPFLKESSALFDAAFLLSLTSGSRVYGSTAKKLARLYVPCSGSRRHIYGLNHWDEDVCIRRLFLTGV